VAILTTNKGFATKDELIIGGIKNMVRRIKKTERWEKFNEGIKELEKHIERLKQRGNR